jgi:hypothetical protein
MNVLKMTLYEAKCLLQFLLTECGSSPRQPVHSNLLSHQPNEKTEQANKRQVLGVIRGSTQYT